jgi:beta-lactamase class A
MLPSRTRQQAFSIISVYGKTVAVRRTVLLLILSAAFLPAQDPARVERMDHRIRTAIAGFHGSTSLYAKNLDTGATFGIRENEKVRTASTIKLAIMAEVFDAVARGRAKWPDPITLHDSDKAGGTGVIPELANGTRLTVRDLVHVMIVLSDNTATNLLLDKFSAEAVNTYMDSLGLPNTRSMRKILVDGKTPSGFSAAGKLDENKRFGLGSSTPREMVMLIEKMERGEVVNPTASKDMIAILKRQQFRNGIARRTGDMPVANKTGALNLMRSDVGIVYSPGGRIAIAITCDDLSKVDYSVDNAGDVFIADLTGILLEGLAKN